MMTDTNNTDGAALLPVTPELSPCPFCGSSIVFRLGGYFGHPNIPTDCPAQNIVIGHSDQAKMAAWNTRAPLHATQEDAERSGVGVSDAVELQEAFDMRWKADMRAVAMWRAENPGNDLVLPDHADLVVWLLDQGDAIAEAASRVLKSAGKWTPDHYELSAHVTTFRDGAALSTPQRQEYDGEAVREALERCAAGLEGLSAQNAADPLLQDWADELAERARAALAHPAQATPSAVSGDAGEVERLRGVLERIAEGVSMPALAAAEGLAGGEY